MKLKSTNKNACNVIYKIKAISHNLCRELGIPLYCTFTKIRLRSECESRFPFSLKYFIFPKWFLKSSGGIRQGQLNGKAGGGVREDSSLGRIQAAPLSWLKFVTLCSLWEASKIKSSKTKRWIIIVTDYQNCACKLQFVWYIDFWISDFNTFKT